MLYWAYRFLKLFWWEKRTHWPGFNSSLSNLARRFSFPKLPSLGWHLGWLVCPVLYVLQSNCFKYQILLSTLLQNGVLCFALKWQNSIFGVLLVAVSWLEGQRLFNWCFILIIPFLPLMYPISLDANSYGNSHARGSFGPCLIHDSKICLAMGNY